PSRDPGPPTAAEVWARARADYEHGLSTPVVAERWGLNERTVRRHAAAEGWVRDRHPGGAPATVIGPDWPCPAPWSGGPRPAAAGAYRTELTALLLAPPPPASRGFAFGRSAEAAAAGRPAEALTWMRLVQAGERAGDRIARDNARFRDADYLRADFLAELQRR